MGRVDEFLLPVRLGTGFRWLIASSWSSNLGDGLAVAAGPLLVASLTDDAFVVSLAALLGWAPPLLFGLFAGALSDRLDRRRIVMVANASRVLVLAALATMLVTGTATVTVALVAFGPLATAEVFADNTTATLTPTLAGIGGALASQVGITAPFWFAFGGSALFVLLLWRDLARIAHDDAPADP